VSPKFRITDLRSYNEVLVFAGVLLVLSAGLSVLILNKTPWWSLVILVVGLVSLGLFLAANLKEVRETGKRHGVQVRANLSLLAISVVVIVVSINYVIQRHPLRYDMTSNKIFTLAPQTRDALKALKSDVTATMFVTQKKQGQVPEVGRARELLRQYSKESKKFRLEVVDADVDASTVKKYGVHEYNTVVFESAGNRKDVLQRDYVTYSFQGRQPTPKFQGEQAFTNALLRMTDSAPLTVYLTEGHGERELGSPQNIGLNIFKQVLEGSNYVVKSLKIYQDKIPADCSVLASVGPSKPFSQAEAEIVREWMKKGGKFILCVDPNTQPGLDGLFADYGVKLGRDIVVDKTSFMMPDLTAVIPELINHAITEKLTENRVFAVIPFCRSVDKTEARLKDVSQSILLRTSDNGWGETDLKGREPKYGPGDRKGPVPMAYAFEWTPPVEGGGNAASVKSRLVVFGSSTFLTNSLGTAPGNMDLGTNAFNWAALQEGKISIRPKEDEQRMLSFTNVGASFVRILVIFLLPIGILAFGGYLWYRRRSL
jgi:ABC-2 type transport system permease protein